MCIRLESYFRAFPHFRSKAFISPHSGSGIHSPDIALLWRELTPMGLPTSMTGWRRCRGLAPWPLLETTLEGHACQLHGSQGRLRPLGQAHLSSSLPLLNPTSLTALQGSFLRALSNKPPVCKFLFTHLILGGTWPIVALHCIGFLGLLWQVTINRAA